MKNPGFNIVMLGAGNLAWHLAPALETAGHRVSTVYSRTLNHAEALAARLQNARATNNPDLSADPADLFIIAVTDSALPELLQQAVFPANSVVAHTSGTQPLRVFEDQPAIRGGVFYPLQTFSKEAPVNFSVIPICLEAADENAMLLLQKTAESLSRQVQKISSEERKILHLAAVFACNFTNHLFGISSGILQQSRLDFKLLQPLVEQTVQKAFLHPPFSVQTVPAVRHDQDTIQAHLELLKNDLGHRQLYELLT
ncbi:MAG TPA: Rossmann-like and DUF2520 domain-containing protein, partial [Adhaeribacter sp.]|nr:Rossmann-like and DUF2520 domain-containing protein [Adhaeribacter sp.]